jgi:predicted nuclease of predicted toxin-antitoxin system
VDIKTAQEDSTSEMEDDQLLDRATALNRALFTRDKDLLAFLQVRFSRNV